MCPRWLLSPLLLALLAVPAPAQSLAESGHVDSGGVKIHYVTLGKGPLMVLIRGFPDYWYSWRDQMPELARHFQVVAIDQRGYNTSDQPRGVENYALDKLVADVDAVVKHFKASKAVVVGHDWGGLVAWTYAMKHPDRTNRLIVLNLPHPKGLSRELANNPRNRKTASTPATFSGKGRKNCCRPNCCPSGSRSRPASTTSRRSSARPSKGCSTITGRTTRKNRTRMTKPSRR